MTETPAPDAAVQIAAGALDSVAIYDERDELAEAACNALARAKWLHDPAEVERLRARITSQDRALRELHRRLGDTNAAEAALAALDAAPAGTTAETGVSDHPQS